MAVADEELLTEYNYVSKYSLSLYRVFVHFNVSKKNYYSLLLFYVGMALCNIDFVNNKIFRFVVPQKFIW